MQADSSGRPRDALPGISTKLDRVSAEMVYRTMCDAESVYLRTRNEAPPKGQEELGRLAGFEILARPTYTEVRRVYNTGIDELTRTKPTGRMAQLIPRPAAPPAVNANLDDFDGPGSDAKAAMRKARSTPTLKDLVSLQSRSTSNEALNFVYKYFSEDHMAAKERGKRTRGGPAAPIPRAGKAVVGASAAVDASRNGVKDSAVSGDVSPSSVSRGVQCDNRKVNRRDALVASESLPALQLPA